MNGGDFDAIIDEFLMHQLSKSSCAEKRIGSWLEHGIVLSCNCNSDCEKCTIQTGCEIKAQKQL